MQPTFVTLLLQLLPSHPLLALGVSAAASKSMWPFVMVVASCSHTSGSHGRAHTGAHKEAIGSTRCVQPRVKPPTKHKPRSGAIITNLKGTIEQRDIKCADEETDTSCTRMKAKHASNHRTRLLLRTSPEKCTSGRARRTSEVGETRGVSSVVRFMSDVRNASVVFVLIISPISVRRLFLKICVLM